MNSMSKLCLFNCTSGIFCLCSETSEGRPLIQSHRKNSGEGRKNQIHHWKCHKDSHCARRHVSALHLSCHTTRKKCILVYWDLLSISFCHARLKQPQNKCTMSKHIYFELRLVFFYISTQETYLLVQKCSDSQLFFFTSVTVSTKTKNGIVLNAGTTVNYSLI